MNKNTNIFLNTSQLNDALIDRSLRDQAINSHLACLTEAVSTIHGLGIVRRIPVMVIEDNGVGCS